MKEIGMSCPNGHGKIVIKKVRKKVAFRGINIIVPIEQYICQVCGVEASTIDQAADIQKAISDAYRKAVNLLTGKEIVDKRKRLKLTQEALAKRMNVGIASIKRWEGGTIQSKSMDHALRIALGGQSVGDSCTGNRPFSIPRIKLVLKEFESILGKHIWYYGKILRKKATIISMSIAPYFYALSENYGSPEEDYLTMYEQGRMTQEAKAVYEALLENGPLDSITLRKSAHLTSKDSESRFTRALSDLQTDFKIMPVAVVDAGSWHYSFAYDIVARHEPEVIEKARFLGELDARQRIIELYFRSVGAAQSRDLVKLFRWMPRDIEQAVGRLVEQGIICNHEMLDGQSGEWIVLNELFQ
ncbi:MAG: type II toxin-antitoxin system MqsA family antitoxin [Methanotrichaceae archaeon]|nr:type II toxin-antitoxin system MqsA family antitoxin [Methanotrichaceae archaeon]